MSFNRLRRSFHCDGGALWLLVAGYWLWLAWSCAGEWTETPDYNYGWFVAPLALYFLWKRMEETAENWRADVGGRRSEAGDRRPEDGLERVCLGAISPSLRSEGRHFGKGWQVAAWVFITLSVLVILPLELARQAPMHWRFYSWMIGFFAFGNTLAVAWLTGGMKRVRVFFVPALFALTGIPWPTFVENAVAFPLMGVVTAWSAGLLHLLGYPATVSGNVITLPNCTVGVEEACSGLRSLQTALMVGLAAGEMKRFGAVYRIILLIMAFVLALAGNQVRVLLLALTGINGGSAAVAEMHDTAGYVVLGIIMAGVAGAAWLLGMVEGTKGQPEVGDRRPEVGGRRSEVGDQRSEVGGRNRSEAEIAVGKSEGGGSEDRSFGVSEASGRRSEPERGEGLKGQTEVGTEDGPKANGSLVMGGEERNKEPKVGRMGAVLFGLAVAAMLAAHAWYWSARGEASQPVAALLEPRGDAGFLVDEEVPESVLEVLRPDDWSYIRAERNGEAAEVVGYHFYWRPGRGNARQMYHRPDACMPGAGWRIDGEVTRETLRVGDRKVVFNVFPFRNPGGRSLIYWAAYLNGQPVELDFKSDLHLATAKLWDFIRKGVSKHSYEVAAFVLPDNASSGLDLQAVQDFANRVFMNSEERD